MSLDAKIEFYTADPHVNLLPQFRQVRAQTMALINGLSDEDMLLQSMPDASPTKWHLAHTTWFYDAFLLQPHLLCYAPFDERYQYLFNSYYEAMGERHPRPARGLLSRPCLSEVLAYRDHVDNAMVALLSDASDEVLDKVIIGLHHEMQHQELILTDIKHALAQNSCAFANQPLVRPSALVEPDMDYSHFKGGVIWVGSDAETDFAYDCERPRHQAFVQDFSLRNSPVSNGEWLDFITDGGYMRPELWLSDGWDRCRIEHWQAPLYWHKNQGRWQSQSLFGKVLVNPQDPVCHISYYEADAFARWQGERLPTEFEWEHAARNCVVEGHFAEAKLWHPKGAQRKPSLQQPSGLKQMYGDVWEWTQSNFSAYPGFNPSLGALGEYNGKFMVNQYVLRGGSCVTPQLQMRPSYRNFFYPHQRWQFSGLRLAH